MTRILIIGPGHRGLLPADAPAPPALVAAEALARAARARDLAVLRLAALAADTAGLRQPPGAVLTGLPGDPSGAGGDTALIVPAFDAGLMLNRSWYLLERLAEFLRAGGFAALAFVHGAPAGLDILALARRTAPGCRTALVLPPAESAPGDRAGGTEARVVAARVRAEMLRAADLVLALPGAHPPEGVEPARIRPAADPAACIEALMRPGGAAGRGAVPAARSAAIPR
ncbi:MAG: hypothetical protein D6686_00115 [Alphaproteobacteria bacterium]|nr:MAG: hypothetical protein D6686_00115 [Alphaproteobacteria bacterium]